MFPIPETLAVMVLSECNLLPHSFLPLFLFEERYRVMLRDALRSTRMFCIGMRRRGAPDEITSPDQLYGASTLGVIRACVGHPDGTSHLILQGLQRIRFVGWEQEAPYRVARIEPIASTGAEDPECADLSRDITQLASQLVRCGCAEMTDQLESHLSAVSNPEVLGDLVAYNFICDAHVRQQLIEEISVPRRLAVIRAFLDQRVAESGGGQA